MLDRHLRTSRALSARRMFEGSLRPLWPVAAFEGRLPAVIETNDGDPGVDLAFARASVDDLVDRRHTAAASGNARHVMPAKWPAIAVWDGVIIHAEPEHLGDGFSIVVDHQNGWATYYSDLETVFATLTYRREDRGRERVQRGDAIGIIGRSSRGALRSLRFELWRLRADHRFIQRIDPRPHLPTWRVLSRERSQLHPTPNRSPRVGELFSTPPI